MRSIIGIIVLFSFILAMQARADGPGPSSFDPPPHPHSQGGEWIMKGQKRNAAGEWCCGEGDCFMVEPVRTTSNGYHVLVTGETVPFSEAQPSPDGKFWRCKRPDGSRRCFFAPPPAM